jgi:signal transduction histidine kinase
MLCVFFLTCSSILSAQQLTGNQLKALYLYNFIMHIDWPDEANKTQYTIGVYGDDDFFQQLNSTLSQRTIQNKPILVKNIADINLAKAVDMLFVAENNNNEISSIASIIRRSNTLLVTDNSIDKHNVMINLVHDTVQSAITFEVNRSNIVFEHLNMSTELLLLGGTELDVATLYRETELAMQKTKQREIELNRQLVQQQNQLSSTAKKLEQLNGNLLKRERTSKIRQQEFNILKLDIEQQRLSIKAKEIQLEEVAKQLSLAKNDLIEQQYSVSEKENENLAMANRISANKDILQQQQQQIDNQSIQLTQKNEELDQRKERIDKQQFYIISMGVFITLVVLFSVLVVVLFYKNKRTTEKLSKTLINLQNMQDQLVQSEKMASLGTLTAGVAHEINTPLGIAVTSSSSALECTHDIKEKFESGHLTRSSMSQYFETIEKSSQLNNTALERVIELLNNFKQVAADQVVGEEREVDIVSYSNEVMSTLSAEMKRSRIKYHYSGVEKLTITTIPGALAQVITNLVTNSIKHAFEEKDLGNISINITLAEDNSILFSYQDDGVGMDKFVLDNIFEPFFTTKRNSGGTGLGMNIVYNIISQKLEGSIQVESTLGKGAKFIIRLPQRLSI